MWDENSLKRKNKAQVNCTIGRLDNRDSTVIISSIMQGSTKLKVKYKYTGVCINYTDE